MEEVNSIIDVERIQQAEELICSLQNDIANRDAKIESLDDQITFLKMEAQKEGSYLVVIPYKSSEKQGEELMYALRGWEKNFKENFKVVVIGDSEPWFNKEHIHHIAHECITNNPPLDIVSKMEAIINEFPEVDKIIWTNDDIYPINPISIHDIEFLKCDGKLDSNYSGGTIYQQNKKKTLLLLQKEKLSIWDYGCHLPVVYETEKLQELIETYKLKEDSYLISSLYFNTYFPEMIPYKLDLASDNLKCGVYRANPNMTVVEKAFTTKKFLNNSVQGYVSGLVKLLKKHLSEKSRFEK